MVDSSSAGLLSELNEKRRRLRVWPFVAVLAMAMTCTLMVLEASPWIVVPIAILSLVGAFCAYQFDLLAKTVVILYDLDSETEIAYQGIHDAVSQLARCCGKWHIDSRGHVYDPKYHGGAGQLVRRIRLSVGTEQPPYVKTNVATPSISLGVKTLYFFPERLLVFTRDGIGAVSYDDLSIVINDKRFIEDDSVPRDAQVVGQTWQFVNKGGGPDRRFKNNRQVPICLYEELWLNSPSGLNEVLHASCTGIGRQLDAALQSVADLVMKAATMPAPPPLPTLVLRDRIPHNRVEPQTPKQIASDAQPAKAVGPDRVFGILLEVLCCLMVADGCASGREKKRVRELMARLHSPWSDSQLDDRIAAFIERVRSAGYRRTLAAALKDVVVFKHLGKQHVLLKCLDAVARADEKLSDRELQLCQRVRAVVEEEAAA
jgi:uncharacterized tellurite resistance protein B-like protein